MPSRINNTSGNPSFGRHMFGQDGAFVSNAHHCLAQCLCKGFFCSKLMGYSTHFAKQVCDDEAD